MIKRRTDSGEKYGATFLELFFDLVFVFAITQVSHLLLYDLSWVGLGQTAMALLVVWWAWTYTTWVSNSLDVDAVPVRLLMMALMLAGLLMAVAIPEAFGDQALLFAGSYVAIQVGRTAFLTFVASDRGSAERQRDSRILIWFCAAAPFWLAGAFFEGELRAGLWLVGLTLDYIAPLLLYRVPGLKPVSPDSWTIGSSHFAERFGLFVIIALGESIILTGATAAKLDLDPAILTSLVIAFAGTAALWWLYFSSISERVEQALASAKDPTLVARDAFTYAHVLIIAGIVLVAVGDEIVVAHPLDELGTAELLAVASGPVLYLLAQSVIKRILTGTFSLRRLVAAGVCVVVALTGLLGAPAMVVGGLLVAVLVGMVVVDEATAERSASPS